MYQTSCFSISGSLQDKSSQESPEGECSPLRHSNSRSDQHKKHSHHRHSWATSTSLSTPRPKCRYQGQKSHDCSTTSSSSSTSEHSSHSHSSSSSTSSTPPHRQLWLGVGESPIKTYPLIGRTKQGGPPLVFFSIYFY